jgi:hypothetical protein
MRFEIHLSRRANTFMRGLPGLLVATPRAACHTATIVTKGRLPGSDPNSHSIALGPHESCLPELEFERCGEDAAQRGSGLIESEQPETRRFSVCELWPHDGMRAVVAVRSKPSTGA